MEETLKSWLKQLKLHESTISMVLGALVVVVVGTLVYNYFVGVSEEGNGEISDEGVTEEYSLELAEDEQGNLVPENLPLTHSVNRGEHLWKIAQTYYGSGYNWVDIASANDIQNPSIITQGQELVIPKAEVRLPPGETLVAAASTTTPKNTTYRVTRGDTLWGIAVKQYQDGFKWDAIYQANREVISNPNIIEVGMELTIPRSASI